MQQLEIHNVCAVHECFSAKLRLISIEVLPVKDAAGCQSWLGNQKQKLGGKPLEQFLANILQTIYENIDVAQVLPQHFGHGLGPGDSHGQCHGHGHGLGY